MDKGAMKTALAEYLVPLTADSILQELNTLKLDRYVKRLSTGRTLSFVNVCKSSVKSV
ncbi:hypothetical protein [Alicyclobacillus fodiniaquatilis]|uniref:Uncharacterized protein n=1 Tax=Alicyclobacillus fodiniaquatilis TaxID=1661150 RepID=A0ABW4JM03_9BACL